MNETTRIQNTLQAIEASTETLRSFAGRAEPSLDDIADAYAAAKRLALACAEVETGSFRVIGERISSLLQHHSESSGYPTDLEREVIALAADWLGQLAVLYQENLPEPKALVGELLYTFDLVESSHDATSLERLYAAGRATQNHDPFQDDPEFSCAGTKADAVTDIFADDPGFGIEFDLLQRTMNGVPFQSLALADPFAEDPMPEENVVERQIMLEKELEKNLPIDIFSEDPAPEID